MKWKLQSHGKLLGKEECVLSVNSRSNILGILAVQAGTRNTA